MIDWRARIDDLAEELSGGYGVEDRPVVEILLAALAPCPRTPSLWLILETNWFSRDCLDAWFSFGRSWAPSSLARLRARSPWREIEAEIKRYLDTPDNERLFVECDFEHYPRFSRLTLARYLLQRAPRIRTLARRTDDAVLTLDRDVRDRRSLALKAAAGYALEDRGRLRPQDPPRFIQPPDFLYQMELLERLAPWYPDFRLLAEAFALIAVRRAWLYGRTETDESDNEAMARALADSIPLWIVRALGLLMDTPSKTETVEKHMRLEEGSRRSGHGSAAELRRLQRGGVVRWDRFKSRWTITREHLEGVRRALDRRAFRPEASRAAPAGG